jgi:hypothetical protein
MVYKKYQFSIHTKACVRPWSCFKSPNNCQRDVSKSKSKGILFFLLVEMVLICVAKTYKSQTVMFFTNGRNTAVDNTFKLNLYGRHTSIGVRSARNFHTIVIINLVHTFKSFLFFKLSSKLRTIKLTAKLSSKLLKKVSALPKPFCIFCKLSRNKELLNYQKMFQINVRIN